MWGAGKQSFHSTFHRIVQQHQPQMYVLMEMRLFGVSFNFIQHRFSLSWSFYVVKFQGLSEEIIIWMSFNNAPNRLPQ